MIRDAGFSFLVLRFKMIPETCWHSCDFFQPQCGFRRNPRDAPDQLIDVFCREPRARRQFFLCHSQPFRCFKQHITGLRDIVRIEGKA